MARPVEVRITGDASGALSAIGSTNRELRQLDQTATKSSGGLRGLSKTLAGIGTAILAGGALREAAGLIKESTGLAANLTETISKTDVIFGKGSKGIQKWAKESTAGILLTNQQVLDTVAGFDLMLGNKGITGARGKQFSKNLTNLSADLASFFNTSPTDAVTAINAALRGENDPIEKYGVALNDATLKAKAFEMGLYSGKGALNDRAKAEAAYAVIMEQTTKAQGDAARTQGSAANQMKQFSKNVTELKTAFGAAFTPLIEEYGPGVNDFLDNLTEKFESKGFKDSLMNVAKDIEKAWPKIKRFGTEIKDSFDGIDAGDLKDTLGGVGEAVKGIASGASTMLKAFNDLSPEAKANLGLIVASGAAFSLAKRNPVVKIGVDLVGGVLTAVGSTLASSLTALKFPSTMRIAGQPIKVTGFVSDGPDGGGGKGKKDTGFFGGKSLKGAGLAAIATLLVPEIINRLPLKGNLKEQVDGAVEVGTWAAMGAAFGGPPGAVLGGIFGALKILGSDYEGLSSEQQATQAQSDYLRNNYQREIPPLQKDTKKTKENVYELQGTSSYLIQQNASQAREIAQVRLTAAEALRKAGKGGFIYYDPRTGSYSASSRGRADGVPSRSARMRGELTPRNRDSRAPEIKVYLDGRQIASYMETGRAPSLTPAYRRP